MKEATGEGSMTIVTIVVIVALGLFAAFVVGMFISQANKEANKVSSDDTQTQMGTGANSDGCENWDFSTGKCAD